jgi:hypothetical protein
MIRHSFRCSLVVLVLYVTSLVAVSDVIAQRRGGFSSPPPRPYTPPPRPYTPPPRPVPPPQRSSAPPPRPIQPPPRPAPQKVTTPGTPNRVQPKDPRIVGPAAGINPSRGAPNGLKREFGSAASRPRVSGIQLGNTGTSRSVLSQAQQNAIRTRLTGTFNKASRGLSGKFNKSARLSLRNRFRIASGGTFGIKGGGGQSGGSSGGVRGSPGTDDPPRGKISEIFKKNADKTNTDKPSPALKPDIEFKPDEGDGVRFKKPTPSTPKP